MGDEYLRLLAFVGPALGAGILALGEQQAARGNRSESGHHKAPKISLPSRCHCRRSHLMTVV